MGLFSFIGGKKHSLLSSGVLQGTADSHSHILFGVDDGVKAMDESLAILKYEESLGVKEVWCTPHIIEDGINDHDLFKANFEQLCEAYDGSIKLHLAAEYMLDTVFEQRFKDRELLTHENNTLLVETSAWTPPLGLHNTLRNIQNAGYRPLLAHPERYRYLKDEDYEKMHEAGVRFQLNLPSLLGYYGDTVKARAEWILKQGWYDAFGSDCHRIRAIEDLMDRKALDASLVEKLKEISLF